MTTETAVKTRKVRAKSVNAKTFIATLAVANPKGELTQAEAREHFKNDDGSVMEKGTFDGKLVQARAIAKAANEANPEKYPMPAFLEFKHGGNGGNGREKGGSMKAALAQFWANPDAGEEIDGI